MPDFIKKELAQLSTRYGALLAILAILWPTYIAPKAPAFIQSIAGSHPTIANWLSITLGAIGAALIAYREQPKTDG